MRLPLVNVAVAIIRRPDGRVLLAERTPRQMGAGLWELPGGKVDPGETAAEAAVRELAEEVGIVARGLRPAVHYEHAYRTRRLRMHFFHVAEWSGTPRGLEGQRLAWVDPARPEVAPLQPSNERCLRALGLPDLYADCRLPAGAGTARALDAARAALAAGARLLCVGGEGLGADQRVGLARRIDALAREAGARVTLDGPLLEVRRCGVSGLHSEARVLRTLASRPPVALWIVHCQDADELSRAIAAGADAAVLSRVLAADADDGPPALGWDGFERLARASAIPVYAGGVTPDARVDALDHGAVGIALGVPEIKAGARPCAPTTWPGRPSVAPRRAGAGHPAGRRETLGILQS